MRKTRANISGIGEVIKAHKSHAHFTSLSKNLGDGFLYRHNPLFRNVRQLFLELGYRFTTEDFCHYQTFPLISLPAILKAKRVPYFDNYSAVAQIERTSPGMPDMGLWPNANHLMHESCHCIADAIFEGLSGSKHIILRSFLCESLANTAESFAGIYAQNKIHRIFYNLNSYQYIAKNNPQAVTINRAIIAVGPANTFKTLFFSFVYANFLYKRVDENDFRNVIDLLQINAAKTLRPVFRIGVSHLDFRFRVETSGFYFRYFHGLHRSIFALTQFDFIRVLKKTPSVLRQLTDISDRLLA